MNSHSEEQPLEEQASREGMGSKLAMKLGNVFQAAVDEAEQEYKEQVENLDKDPLAQMLSKIPPDFHKAEIHGMATSVVDPSKITDYDTNNPDTFCECCSLPVPTAGSQFPLCVNVHELSHLGTGFSVYYDFKKSLILVFAVLSLVVGIPATIMVAIIGEDSPSTLSTDEEGVQYSTLVSVGNIFTDYILSGDDQYLRTAQGVVWLNVIGILILLLYSVIIRSRLVAISQSLDNDYISPADFAILVRNLSPTMTKDKLKAVIEKQCPSVKVEYVNFCYQIDEMIKATSRLQTLYIKKGIFERERDAFLEKEGKTLEEYHKDPAIYEGPEERVGMCLLRKQTMDINEINREILQKKKELEDYEQRFQSENQKDSLFCGKAFVIFEKPIHTKVVMAANKHTFLGLLFKKYICGCCFEKDSVNAIIFEDAPEPTDVYWEHLDVRSVRRIVNVCITYAVSLALVGVSFGIIYGLTKAKLNYQESHEDDDSNAAFIISNLLSLTVSFTITGINSSLRIVVRKFSLYEQNETLTAHNLSVALKLTLVRFINTALVPITINRQFAEDNDEWFGAGGLISDVFYIFLSIGFLDTFLYLTDYMYIYKKIKRCISKHQGENSKINQQTANQLFEGPKLDMANIISKMYTMILCTLFFAPLFPISIVLCLLSLLWGYGVEKYNLLRRHKVPEQMGPFIVNFMANLLPYMAFLWALALVFFFNTLYRRFYEDYLAYLAGPIFILVVVFIFLIFPVRSCINRCITPADPQDILYQEQAGKFISDYDSENPATKKEGEIRLLELRQPKDKEQSEEEKKHMEKQKALIAGASVFDAVRNYNSRRDAQKFQDYKAVPQVPQQQQQKLQMMYRPQVFYQQRRIAVNPQQQAHIQQMHLRQQQMQAMAVAKSRGAYSQVQANKIGMLTTGQPMAVNQYLPVQHQAMAGNNSRIYPQLNQAQFEAQPQWQAERSAPNPVPQYSYQNPQPRESLNQATQNSSHNSQANITPQRHPQMMHAQLRQPVPPGMQQPTMQPVPMQPMPQGMQPVGPPGMQPVAMQPVPMQPMPQYPGMQPVNYQMQQRVVQQQYVMPPGQPAMVQQQVYYQQQQQYQRNENWTG